MARSFVIYCFMFFAIVQGIPGSMQAVADHLIEPMLIQSELLIVDAELDVKCCDENNKKDATPCFSDYSAILGTIALSQHDSGALFERDAHSVLARLPSLPDLRPPIS